MSTSNPEVQWRQGANGGWEYLASDGQWYAANPAAGTPVPPSGSQSDGTILPTPQAEVAPAYPQMPVATPGVTAPGYVYSPGYVPPQMSCPHCGTLYDPNKRACPNCGTLTGFPYAQLTNPGKRLGQYALDWLLGIVTLGIGYLIWSFIIWGRGQTPGMQVLHIRVVNKEDLTVSGWGTMAMRQIVGQWLIMGAILFIFFPAWVILCFMILWDEDRQELWDKVAGTLVIDGDPPQPPPSVQQPALPT